jgi:hypothetical protein
MTTISFRRRVSFAVGAAVPLLLFGAGLGPAYADDMNPAPVPAPGPYVPADPWQDPLLSPAAIDSIVVPPPEGPAGVVIPRLPPDGYVVIGPPTNMWVDPLPLEPVPVLPPEAAIPPPEVSIGFGDGTNPD